MEQIDILKPPTFKKSGQTKDLAQAWKDEDWIGTFNLWIVQSKPEPAIIYQQRSPKSSWAPNKLDVSAGGHYAAGEQILDGMREVKEELGKSYAAKDLISLGRKINVSPDVHGHERKNIVDIFMVLDNSPMADFNLQEQEVYAICACPISELLKIHINKDYSFVVNGLNAKKQTVDVKVNQDSFPYNWDNYHYKIVLLADRFIKGQKNLLY